MLVGKTKMVFFKWKFLPWENSCCGKERICSKNSCSENFDRRSLKDIYIYILKSITILKKNAK